MNRSSCTPVSKKPNILWILCDQFRFDALSILGHPVVKTPHLDTLAGQGLIFTNAYSPAPSCIPARACLFTGMSPNQTGFLGYEDGHDWNFTGMLPELLRNHGYQTHCTGKTHFFPQGKHCGYEGLDSYECWQKLTPWYVNDYEEWLREKSNGRFDERMSGLDDNSWIAAPSILPEELHNNTWVITKGLEFLRRRDRTRPYFLTLSFHRPHPPFDPPARFYEMYQNQEADQPPIGDWANIHDKPVNGLHAWEGRLPEKQLAQMRLAYYAQISHIDNQIGRLIRTLQSNRDLPDVIVFTSDHGEMLGDHHLLRKTYAYEGSAGVPLIIWEKDAHYGEKIETPVVLQDLYSTTLSYAGIEIPSEIDGKNLRPLYSKDARCFDRSFIHGEHAACYSPSEAMQYLTDGRFKYIWFTEDGRELLFDLTEDPYECHNLSEKNTYRKELQKWRQRLIQILAERPKDGLSDGHHLMPDLLPALRKK